MTSDKSEGVFYSEAWYVHPYTFVYSETTVCFSPSFEGSDAKWHILSMPRNEKASLLQSEGFGVQRRYALGLTLVLCYLNEGIKNHHLSKEFLTSFLLFHILPFFVSDVAQPLDWLPFLIAGVRERKPFLLYH